MGGDGGRLLRSSANRLARFCARAIACSRTMIIAIVRYQDRERHRFRWPIEFDRDDDERLRVGRLWTVSRDLRMDLDRNGAPPTFNSRCA